MPIGVYERTKPAWNKGLSVPGRKCGDDCTCGRHKADTPERAALRHEVMIGKNAGRKYGPPTPEHREKNRKAQIGNQRARGIKHSPEQRARRARLTREMWNAGIYDAGQQTWGKPGIHAGVKMRCLNSEGVLARDLDEVHISWLYEPRRFKLSWCTYKPDFYLPEFDIWIEVKGWPQQTGNWPQKVDSFREETGKTLVVVFQSELSARTYGVGESDSEDA